MAEKVERPTTPPAARSGVSARSKLALICCAVKTSPLCHMTPWRILKVQTVRSSLASQLSASMGRVTLSVPTKVRYSTMWRVWLDISTQA